MVPGRLADRSRTRQPGADVSNGRARTWVRVGSNGNCVAPLAAALVAALPGIGEGRLRESLRFFIYDTPKPGWCTRAASRRAPPSRAGSTNGTTEPSAQVPVIQG